jgi:AcrR family transcriptional regulator
MRQRARSVEDKQARRRAILDAATATLESGRPIAAITMSEVAERAGLVKGTVYIYFDTKEQLLLALLGEKLEAWFVAVTATLEAGRGRWSARRVATVIVDHFGRDPQLTQLLAVLSAILEHNIDYETALAFKRGVVAQLEATGTRIESRLGLKAGQGLRALLHAHALLVGMAQLAAPAPVVQKALELPELAPLRIDFQRDLTDALELVLEGLQQRT